MSDESSTEKSSSEYSREASRGELIKITRRKFITWGSLVAGWVALPKQSPTLALKLEPQESHAPKSSVTLIQDGSFQEDGLGWQLGRGCQIISENNASSGKVLQVQARGTSTARAVVLSPRVGGTYTVHGIMRTNGV